ncbi:uncharacterized protein [Anoplolepis gracilipes]|uniref:uncharacterized protein n=1 Tax=Anoplolepis gracilipes TaxID=354296 RepID=UPI003B9E66FE
MPAQIRELFAYICIFGNPTDVPTLWNKYKDQMIEDFVNNNVVDPENMALNHIQEILRNNGSSCGNFQLPNPIPVNIYVTEYNVDEEKRPGEYLLSTLNDEQKHVYNIVIRVIDNENEPQRLFYIDGFAGSGKTYLFNTFLSVIRRRNEIIIPCASTGIAATLLKGGKTYHSLFKLLIPIDDGAKSNIRGNSQAARELISAKLIIWDEVTVGHALTAVDKLFKDLMKNERPFGGKVILFAGDFRQNLPVVPHAQKVALIESTVKYNPIWRNVTQVKLQQNMRTGEEKEFANWLMQLGDDAGWVGTARYVGPQDLRISTLSIFLWGYCKEVIYKTLPEDIEDLETKLRFAIWNIDKEIMENVERNLLKRMRACVRMDGGHFEHLL